MTDLSIDEPVNMKELQRLLELKFSHLQVQTPRFTKKAVIIIDDASIVLLQKRTGTLRIIGTLNVQKKGIILRMLFGMILGVLPAIVFALYCRSTYREKYEALEIEVTDFVTQSYPNIKKLTSTLL